MDIKGNKLLIELDNFTTKEDVKNVKRAIIDALQMQFMNEVPLDKEKMLSNYILLEILKDLERD